MYIAMYYGYVHTYLATVGKTLDIEIGILYTYVAQFQWLKLILGDGKLTSCGLIIYCITVLI